MTEWLFRSKDILRDIFNHQKPFMRSLMKTTTTMLIALQSARLLKLAGIAMILISLLDFILLPIPIGSGVEWSLKITTEMIDRGTDPLLGMALVFSGYGFENLASSTNKPKRRLDLKFWVFLISAILGLVFLAITPLHINNVVKNRNLMISQINQAAQSAQQELEIRLEQQAIEIQNLLANQPNLNDYINQNKLSADELSNLQKFKDDPNALNQQMATIRARLEAEIEAKKQASEHQSKVTALKSLWRGVISSLLLASCHLTIAWTGFKSRTYKPKIER
jgi:hypothetical protein